MAKMIKLMLVSADNNNKYYNMTDTGDGNFLAEYGRVGASPQKKVYPIGKWESTRKSKVRKGYKDITELCVEDTGDTVDFQDISDLAVKRFIAQLQAYAKKEVATFYNVSANAVTAKQVAEAQSLLEALMDVDDLDDTNSLLIELYQVIPRRMTNVNDYLLRDFLPSLIDPLLAREQALLDTMASQVNQATLTKENIDDSVTILDAMGLDIRGTTDFQVEQIKNKLGNISSKYANSFEITNRKTQKIFDDYVSNSRNKLVTQFFHGSRNENWLSIMETGLVLRPTNAVISGKMFGYGTYFADKAQKSYGYTSGRGSYWANGRDDRAIMALFDVHLGKSLEVQRHESWCGSLNEAQLRARGDYDSLFAKAGQSLQNNEYIVYRQEQSTIKYIIELKG